MRRRPVGEAPRNSSSAELPEGWDEAAVDRPSGVADPDHALTDAARSEGVVVTERGRPVASLAP